MSLLLKVLAIVLLLKTFLVLVYNISKDIKINYGLYFTWNIEKENREALNLMKREIQLEAAEMSRKRT